MTKETAIKLFEEKQVRSIWDAKEEKWYISIVDVIALLTESSDANAYWRKLKQRLKEEGNETVTNCHGLKMLAADGKMRMTDVADVEQLFRLIQFSSYAFSYPKNSGTGEGRSALWNFDLSQVLDWEKELTVGIGYFQRLIFCRQNLYFRCGKPLRKLPSFDRIVFPIPIHQGQI